MKVGSIILQIVMGLLISPVLLLLMVCLLLREGFSYAVYGLSRVVEWVFTGLATVLENLIKGKNE